MKNILKEKMGMVKYMYKIIIFTQHTVLPRKCGAFASFQSWFSANDVI